jgi:hypothetical protein
MSLKLYLDNSWIRGHETSRQEIAELLAIADRDIQQSQTPGLGPEWRFGIAYNAALQLATAALAAAGYQAERQNKHQRTVECLTFTVGSSVAKSTSWMSADANATPTSMIRWVRFPNEKRKK